MPSQTMQRCLENRLRARLDAHGSPEYVLTWKRWDMLSGPPICALRASARRISDSDCGGWPTQKAATGDYQYSAGNHEKIVLNLSGVAKLAGYPTPKANEKVQSPEAHEKGFYGLVEIVKLAGYGTPRATDGSNGGPNQADPSALPRQISGAITTSSTSGTEKPGVLNPALSRWLMGFPPEWDACAVTAMQSCRKRRRNSSKKQPLS
jgi:hypothetical protein